MLTNPLVQIWARLETYGKLYFLKQYGHFMSEALSKLAKLEAADNHKAGQSAYVAQNVFFGSNLNCKNPQDSKI